MPRASLLCQWHRDRGSAVFQPHAPDTEWTRYKRRRAAPRRSLLPLGGKARSAKGAPMTAFLIHNMAPLMFAGLIVVMLLGYPVAFALAAVGIGFGLLGIELGLLQATLFQALPERIWGVMSNDTLLAIP